MDNKEKVLNAFINKHTIKSDVNITWPEFSGSSTKFTADHIPNAYM